MRVIVIGSRGHLGSRIVHALGRLNAVEVVCAGRTQRRPEDRIVDLKRRSTFSSLRDADVIVNATSSHAANPDEIIDYALQHGHTLIETSSDRNVISRALALRGVTAHATGTVVLGAGIFTGLSNLLGAAAISERPHCDRLELAVRSSPFSGAGAGTVDLMLDSLRTPACRIVEGRPLLLSPISRGPDVRVGERALMSLIVSLGEPQMLHASCGVPNISMVMLPKPAALARAFLAIPAWMLASRAYRAWMRLQFTLLRRLLLRQRPTRVELFARACDSSSGKFTSLKLGADDGMWTAGVAVAAIARLLHDQTLEPGVHCIDECLSLQAVIERMRGIDGSCIQLRTEPSCSL